MSAKHEFSIAACITKRKRTCVSIVLYAQAFEKLNAFRKCLMYIIERGDFCDRDRRI